jgi:flagellar protein FliS
MSQGSTAALNVYRNVGAHAQVAAADPHRLIQLMLSGALERVMGARGHLERGEIARKGEQIAKAVTIVGSLSDSLDLDRGGDVATNLRSLYDYLTRRLTEANLYNQPAILDEVAGLLREIKSGWDAIAMPATQPMRGA